MLSFGKQLLTFVHFRRILKNRQKAEAPQCVFEKSEIRTWVNPQKASVYSIQGTIGGLELPRALLSISNMCLTL